MNKDTWKQFVSNDGWTEERGPLSEVFTGYEKEVAAIEEKYDVNTRKGETVFYGASNFRLWKNIDKDLAQFKAQNHGFGGSTDKLLLHYADRILYPYDPSVIVVQSSSNDFSGLTGTLEERVATTVAFKKVMYEQFHGMLPDASIVVLGMVIMPAYPAELEMFLAVNKEIKAYCEEKDYMSFVDFSEMSFDGSSYRTELFKSDGIHFNRDGQLLWCKNHIKPALEKLGKF